MTPNQFSWHVFQAHRTLPHGDRPTKKHVAVARALARHPSRMPSHRQIARQACCCVRTVRNALTRLRGLGMIDWKQIFDRRMRPTDRRRQRPSLYLFIATFLFPTPDQSRARGRYKKESKTPSFLGGKHSSDAIPSDEKHALMVKWGLA
jgi:hypothetical protein